MANRAKPQPGKGTAPPKHQHAASRLDDHVDELKQAFDLFDVDGSGVIDINDFKAAINSLGFDLKNQAISQFLSEIDEDGSGTIDFDEFLNMMKGPNEKDISRAELAKGFQQFDIGNTGFITLEDLRTAANEFGEQVSDEVLMEMIRVADTQGKGQVNIEDYYNVLTKQTFT